MSCSPAKAAFFETSALRIYDIPFFNSLYLPSGYRYHLIRDISLSIYVHSSSCVCNISGDAFSRAQKRIVVIFGRTPLLQTLNRFRLPSLSIHEFSIRALPTTTIVIVSSPSCMLFGVNTMYYRRPYSTYSSTNLYSYVGDVRARRQEFIFTRISGNIGY